MSSDHSHSHYIQNTTDLCIGYVNATLKEASVHIRPVSFCLFVCCFFKTGFPSVALEPVLVLALVDQAGLELTEKDRYL